MSYITDLNNNLSQAYTDSDFQIHATVDFSGVADLTAKTPGIYMYNRNDQSVISAAYNSAVLQALEDAGGMVANPLMLTRLNQPSEEAWRFVIGLVPVGGSGISKYLPIYINYIGIANGYHYPYETYPRRPILQYSTAAGNAYVTSNSSLTDANNYTFYANASANFNIPTASRYYYDRWGGWQDLRLKILYDSVNKVLAFQHVATYNIDTYMYDPMTEQEVITDTTSYSQTLTTYLVLGRYGAYYDFDIKNGGGLYPMPTSLIPLRDTLNPHGTNFRTAIDVYDETNQDVNNMFLANYVGTLPYTYVRFAEPGGTIRCGSAMQFTHFVGTSFTYNSIPRVYRVTKRTVINKDVIEYDFTLDYLKDYWQHFGVTEDNQPILSRSTYAADYNKYMLDALPLSGEWEKLQITDYLNFYACIVVNTADNNIGYEQPVQAYAMPIEYYRNFLNWWATDPNAIQYQEAIFSMIEAVYLLPSGSGSTIYRLDSTQSIDFYIKSAGVTVSWSDPDPTSNTLMRVYTYNLGGNSGLNNYTGGVFTTTPGFASDYRYYNSEAIAHMPCYGDVTLPPYALIYLDRTGTLSYRYIIDILNGSIAVAFEPYNTVLDAVALPQLPLPCNTAASTIRNAERNRSVNYTSAAIGAVGSALSLNVGGLVSSVANLSISNKQIDNQIAAASEGAQVKTLKSTGLISAGERPTIKFNLPALAMPADDYYEIAGYPCLKKWVSARDGERYWIDISKGLCGTPEYIAGVKAAINGVGIVYNYT